MNRYRVYLDDLSMTVEAHDHAHAEHLVRFLAMPDGSVKDRGPAWSIVDLDEFPDDDFCTNCGHATSAHDLPPKMAVALGKVCNHVGCKCNKPLRNATWV